MRKGINNFEVIDRIKSLFSGLPGLAAAICSFHYGIRFSPAGSFSDVDGRTKRGVRG
jgi:hypothetical protein